MGAGLYMMVLYGVTEKQTEELFGETRHGRPTFALATELEEPWPDCMCTPYECDTGYVGFPLAVSEPWLANCSSHEMAAPIEREYIPLDREKLKKKYAEQLQEAKKRWNEGVKPVLEDNGIDATPKIHLISEWD